MDFNDRYTTSFELLDLTVHDISDLLGVSFGVEGHGHFNLNSPSLIPRRMSCHRNEPIRQSVGNISVEVKIFRIVCSLPHTDSEIEALVQRLINEDKGRQDALLELAFLFEDSCAVRDDLRKAYEKCNDISQESRALIGTLLKESSERIASCIFLCMERRHS
ncbi:hypothetical protein Tco_0585303 [Tanacetum coccineum]